MMFLQQFLVFHCILNLFVGTVTILEDPLLLELMSFTNAQRLQCFEPPSFNAETGGISLFSTGACSQHIRQMLFRLLTHVAVRLFAAFDLYNNKMLYLLLVDYTLDLFWFTCEILSGTFNTNLRLEECLKFKGANCDLRSIGLAILCSLIGIASILKHKSALTFHRQSYKTKSPPSSPSLANKFD